MNVTKVFFILGAALSVADANGSSLLQIGTDAVVLPVDDNQNQDNSPQQSDAQNKNERASNEDSISNESDASEAQNFTDGQGHAPDAQANETTTNVFKESKQLKKSKFKCENFKLIIHFFVEPM